MVSVDKQTLKFLALLHIESMDENSDAYAQASEILLILAGVTDADGNLTSSYANSDFWAGGNDGTPLRPSAKAEIAAMLPPEMRHLVKPTAPKQDEQPKAR